MPTLTLTPKLQITQPPSEPVRSRRSLLGVIWGKLLTWIEDANSHDILKVGRRLLLVASVGLAWFVPQPFFRSVLYLSTWHSYRIPFFVFSIVLLLKVKTIWTWTRRKISRRGNQHTLGGIAVSELANFLIETGAFKKEDAQSRLAMTAGEWLKVAESLEKYGVLTRGESNARVLRPITREQLVLQLRGLVEKKHPPLVWDEEREDWFERDGAFARHLLAREFEEKKRGEKTDRAERRLDRIKKQIGDATVFQSLMAGS